MTIPMPQAVPGTDAAGQFRPLLQLTGTLLRDAEVRMQAVGPADTPMPVLCLDMLVDGPGQRTVHAEQAYPLTSRFAADAQALQLRTGAKVSIKADPQAMCLSLPLVKEVLLHA